MKRILFTLGLLPVVLISTASAQYFTVGDLAVLRLGDGSAALNSAATAGFIDQYTTLGGLVSSLSLPSTGSSALTWSGSATSEGALTRSSDGSVLTLVGYNTAAGTTGVASTTAASAPRGVATVNTAGTFALAATTTTAFSGNNIRSGVTDGAGNYWGAGAGSGTATGVNYFGTAAAAAPVLNVNARIINLLNNSLYYSVASGSTTRGIYTFNGTPTSAATGTQIIQTGSTSSPYDFALNAAGDVMYIADDSSATSGGGIQKWTLSGSTWSQAYVLSTGTVGARSLAVDYSGANPVIYAITAEGSANRLVEVTDAGSGSTATTLATAPSNEIFRGVDFAPAQVPEPGSLALLGLGGLFLVRKFSKRG